MIAVQTSRELSDEMDAAGIVGPLGAAPLLPGNVTKAGSPYRAYQSCLKGILDAANNNSNWVN